MSFLDSIVDPYFKKSKTGKTLFFPWGFIGKGYEITSELQLSSLRSTLKVFSIGLFLLVAVYFQLTNWVYPVVLTALSLGVYALWATSVTKGMAVSPEKLSYYERIKEHLKYHGTGSLVIGALFMFTMCICCGLMAYFEPDKRFVGSLGVVLFGALTVLWVFIMIDRLRPKHR
jgi:hypothetical protein